uniref:RLR CTR domain-containing protein n=1 Tax=Gongylonema pulchrum TaxID=637853 RepID=A0A183EUH1_9BILA
LERERQLKDVLKGKCYDLKCHLCGSFVCKSTDMRVACESHYVCCDPNIWGRVDSRIHNSKSVSIATLVGKIHCKGSMTSGCNEVLGTVVRLYGAFLPTIAAKSILIEGKDIYGGRAQLNKKWEIVVRELFYVEPITDKDLKLMLNSLFSYSAEQHYQFEEEAELVVQRAAAEMKERKQHHQQYSDSIISMDDDDW